MSAGSFLKRILGPLDTSTLNKKVYDSLESDQRDMIRGVVELSGTIVKEVMVPRTDTVFLSLDAPEEELLGRITETGHSRFPVYRDTIDNVVGVLYAKDVLSSLVKKEPLSVEALARKPFFVPGSKHIDELLRELRRRKVHIAVVVDEYGGVSGIVCMEDIIEQIIGDMQDEFDNEQEDVMETGKGVFLCDARVNLSDLSEELKVKLPIDEFDTLGGFVLDLFGKIPVKHEKAVYEGTSFIIQDMEGHRINTVRIILSKEGNT